MKFIVLLCLKMFECRQADLNQKVKFHCLLDCCCFCQYYYSACMDCGQLITCGTRAKMLIFHSIKDTFYVQNPLSSAVRGLFTDTTFSFSGLHPWLRPSSAESRGGARGEFINSDCWPTMATPHPYCFTQNYAAYACNNCDRSCGSIVPLPFTSYSVYAKCNTSSAEPRSNV